MHTLINKLKTIDKESYETYLKSVSFTNYSFFNSMLILTQGASQVAGFNYWKEKGYPVKKGSKAVYILAPCVSKKTIINPETNKEEEKVFLYGFKSVPVFDISCTDCKSIERHFTISAEEVNIKTLADKFGITLVYTPLEVAKGGFIALKDNKPQITLNSNLSETENKGTFLHELSHYLLDHLEEDKRNKSIIEQEAESLCFILCSVFNVVRHSEFYLNAWGSDETIMQSLESINKAYNKFKKEMGQ